MRLAGRGMCPIWGTVLTGSKSRYGGFEACCETVFYTPKFYLLNHLAEDMSWLTVLKLACFLEFERFNIDLKR